MRVLVIGNGGREDMNTVTVQMDVLQLELIQDALLSAARSMDRAALWAKANEYRRLCDTIEMSKPVDDLAPLKAAKDGDCNCGVGHMTMIGHSRSCPFIRSDAFIPTTY